MFQVVHYYNNASQATVLPNICAMSPAKNLWKNPISILKEEGERRGCINPKTTYTTEEVTRGGQTTILYEAMRAGVRTFGIGRGRQKEAEKKEGKEEGGK